MRVEINLASRPYQDEGQFYRRWGTALGLMVLLTAILIAISIRHYQESRKNWASAREAETKLAELRKEEAAAKQILAQPQNRGTRDNSQFLNAAIQRKSFSWTRLMEDLEKIMPAGIRVVSITPVLDQHNGFVLKLELEGRSREGAVELLRNMERSKRFRDSQLLDEKHAQNPQIKGQEGVRSGILSSYVPGETLGKGD
jgi:type IV pilus assembly protein PilN